MASAEELVAHIEVGKSQVDEDKNAITGVASGVDATVTQISAAKSQAEELSNQLQGMNISDKASQAMEVASKLDEAIAQAGVVKSQAEQVNTAADGVKTKLDEAIMAAQTLMGLNDGGSPKTVAQPSPNQTSTSDHELAATTGEPLQSPQGGPDDTSPHRAELKSSDDGDSTKSKFQRGLRAAVRNVGDVRDQSIDTAKPVYKILDDGWEPPNQDRYESTTQADSRPSWEAPIHAKVEGHDVVGNLAVLTAFGAELLSRGLKRLMRGKANSR